jgi:CHAT domain-containing protein
MDKISIEKGLTYLIQLAVQFHEQGNTNFAIDIIQSVLCTARSIYPRNHINLAATINYLSELYTSQGNLDRAILLCEEVLDIYRLLFERSNHKNLAAILNNLAMLYQQQWRLAEAELLLVESLERCRRRLRERDHNELACCIQNLANLYRIQGKVSKSEALFIEVLSMQRRLYKSRKNHRLAISLNNLGLLYFDQGKSSAALPLYEEALEIQQELLGNIDHPDLAASKNNLAQVYQHGGELFKAELMFIESLGMRRRLSRECTENDLATSINNLADLYRVQGKISKAEPLFVESLEMCRRLFRDRDNNYLAISISNLATLYQSQNKLTAAEHLFVEALEMRQRLFIDRDNNNLALSINALATFYCIDKKPEKAFPLLLETLEVEENTLRHWFSYSTEENRLNFVEGMQLNLKILVSAIYQYFPNDSEKIAQVAIAVARRKAFAAQAEVELNYQRYGDKYPDLAEDFQELATTQGKLTHINHTYSHHQDSMDAAERDAHQQVKQTLTERIEQLERKLSANVPELRQLQQNVTLSAIFAALPKHSCAIEFYSFDVYNFGANEWQAPQYVAFILTPAGNVRMVKLGDARELDELINNYRDLSHDSLLPSFGARPNSASQQPKPKPEVDDLSIDLQLSQRLLTPILDAINGEIKHLIFIPDGALNTLPIGNLLVGQETRLFQKVGFLGGSLSDRFVCTYLSTLRELLTRTDRPNRPLSAPIAIGNPNYDYPDSAEASPTLAGAGLSTMKSMMGQLGAVFTPVPESQLLLDSLKLQLTPDAQFFSQDRATETVLRDAKSPKLLVILTHGYLLDGDRDKIQLIFKLLECPEGEELDLIQTYRHLLDRDFLRLLNLVGDCLDKESLNGGDFCRSFGEFLQAELPELVNRTSGHSIDPMQNHGLALAGANSWLAGEKLPAEIGKGFLLARDVAYLDLFGTEIVFLIACSSGLGDVKTGEGVFGLRRAFAIAGVKQLITSLWDVPTRPTMLLTDKFFEAYHRGVVPAIALQTAQQYVRDISREELAATKLGMEILVEIDRLARCGVRLDDADYPLRHPYFWGAWICQGV